MYTVDHPTGCPMEIPKQCRVVYTWNTLANLIPSRSPSRASLSVPSRSKIKGRPASWSPHSLSLSPLSFCSVSACLNHTPLRAKQPRALSHIGHRSTCDAHAARHPVGSVRSARSRRSYVRSATVKQGILWVKKAAAGSSRGSSNTLGCQKLRFLTSKTSQTLSP